MSAQSLPDLLVFHGNGGSYPPHGTITASDHGPAVAVATWIMICLMGLSVMARLGSTHRFDKASVAICIACVRLFIHPFTFTDATRQSSFTCIIRYWR